LKENCNGFVWKLREDGVGGRERERERERFYGGYIELTGSPFVSVKINVLENFLEQS
jgi:hypothetical protein